MQNKKKTEEELKEKSEENKEVYKKTNNKESKVTCLADCLAIIIGLAVSTFTFIVISYIITNSFLFGFDNKVTRFIAIQQAKFGMGKVFTLAELKQYDGSDPNKPIYLAIRSRVYDVSAGKGRKTYGKGGSYNHFAGRDATRAFVTGNFKSEGLVSDESGLTADQKKSIDNWEKFYDTHADYFFVGNLIQ